jgi:hypothetical protein
MSLGGVVNNFIKKYIMKEKFIKLDITLNKGRYYHNVYINPQIKNHNAIIIGGGYDKGNFINNIEEYNTTTNIITDVNTTNQDNIYSTIKNMKYYSCNLLSNLMLLIIGGYDREENGITNKVIIYSLMSNRLQINLSKLNNLIHHRVVIVNKFLILISGGHDDLTVHNTMILYNTNPLVNDLLIYESKMIVPRYGHTMTMLSDKKILITGGYDINNNVINIAEIYDNINNVFIKLDSHMIIPRGGHSAVLLKNGNVLITGGDNGIDIVYNSAEIWDITFNKFILVDSNMKVCRTNHTMTLLENGSVYIIGGATSIKRKKNSRYPINKEATNIIEVYTN